MVQAWTSGNWGSERVRRKVPSLPLDRGPTTSKNSMAWYPKTSFHMTLGWCASGRGVNPAPRVVAPPSLSRRATSSIGAHFVGFLGLFEVQSTNVSLKWFSTVAFSLQRPSWSIRTLNTFLLVISGTGASHWTKTLVGAPCSSFFLYLVTSAVDRGPLLVNRDAGMRQTSCVGYSRTGSRKARTVQTLPTHRARGSDVRGDVEPGSTSACGNTKPWSRSSMPFRFTLALWMLLRFISVMPSCGEHQTMSPAANRVLRRYMVR
mmetsp:Transcript_29881/g.87024  ORF Transcript_29881/g.87024 Transcript_29881/m.87024 type:complete len:262 (-) Transcript_29881:1825-2610(-)